MDHIFGDSHDIAFGGQSPSVRTQKPTNITPATQRAPLPVHQDDFQDLEDHKAPVRTAPTVTRASIQAARPAAPLAARRPQAARPVPVAEASPLPALVRLIDGMKPSFLPREEDTTVMRLVPISSHETPDPLLLITRDDTTLVVGSGFGSMHRSGQDYMTFPDMRLIASEKSRLSAWVLLDPAVDVQSFQTILPAVGFPPIYATRDIIAKFRNTITDTEFLSKCRFFELFADGMSDRRIGDIELRLGSTLTIASSGAEIGFAHLPLSGTSVAKKMFTRDKTNYTYGDEKIVSGEIISLRSSGCTRHSMKFTFDTFFIDKNSVGVAAGYTLSDRDQLAENGVLMFTLEEDMRARTIAGHIFIDSRGFVHAHEMMAVHKEVLKGIRATYEKMITENPKIDRGNLVQGLRREITKYCYLLTGRTPVVMPILIER